MSQTFGTGGAKTWELKLQPGETAGEWWSLGYRCGSRPSPAESEVVEKLHAFTLFIPLPLYSPLHRLLRSPQGPHSGTGREHRQARRTPPCSQFTAPPKGCSSARGGKGELHPSAPPPAPHPRQPARPPPACTGTPMTLGAPDPTFLLFSSQPPLQKPVPEWRYQESDALCTGQ